MADENDTATAVLEPPPTETQRPDMGEWKVKKEKKHKKGEDDYEAELQTPFGKLEFEFEPTVVKQEKDRKKREKAEKEAAKAAEKAAAKASKAAKTEGDTERALQLSGNEMTIVAKKGGSRLPLLIIVGLIIGAVILAVWLFARPGEEDEMVPEEFRNEEAVPATGSQTFMEKARRRIREAVRSGRSASREAQEEQQRRFEQMTQTS
jgi:hypothetical protein